MRILLKMVLALSLVSIMTISGQDFMTDINNYDILIQNGTIIDGSGSPGFRADILVMGEQIVLIGDVDPDAITVKTIIDATDMVVTPGFIDNHAHGNPLKTPEFKNFSAMGVTTIFLGQDGVSSENISEWMKDVDASELGINIGTYVGHGSIRNQAGVELDPEPSYRDKRKMARLVDEALEAGCFGLST
ncbi:MAG: N-acyl-D-amino acid deacylase, partial [Candidatus Marinimicrobia bacterium]|nr:N-acyl-D-amino acid deacylase [Candidatus Neomarinimicrobiota bacterium]